MPQPPTKRAKKSYSAKNRENRERARLRRKAESIPERERRLQRDRERARRRIRAESTQERETRLQEGRERSRRRRKANSTPSVVVAKSTPSVVNACESTPEREIRVQLNRENALRRLRAQLKEERETRLQEGRERYRRKAKSTPSVVECETTQRPSRRAATVVLKKISNIVCSNNLKEDPDFNANASAPPKPPIKTEKAEKRTKIPTPPLQPPPPEPEIEIGLDMECEEELLSETQAKTLSKAQSHYNLVMMGLRELVQCNVKVNLVDLC